MTEKLKIPDEVIDSDWRDDIELEPYEREADYVSPESVSPESIDKIKSIRLRGHKVFGLFNKEKLPM